MENELTTNKKNAFQRFASVFNCFKKKKRKTLEHNERDKTVKFTMNVNDKETVELISEVLNHFHSINTKLGDLMFDDVFEIVPNKRTQSVTQRIHARPRKSTQIVKHKRVMRRKLIDVIQLDSRPDIDLVLNLINIHIDASFNEYQGDFNKLF